jgi:glycosyltransferase involved in cell wall biosynthesis/GT2 family glycosyltransferase
VVVTVRATVVVCTRDRPALLARALDSVLPQVGPDDEVVVVDDGSDPPVRGAPGWRGRARVVRTAGIGPAGARAAGLEAARGDYVAWCDDDDEWLPGHLETLVTALDADRSVAVVYADAEWHAPEQAASLPYSLEFDGYVLAEWNYLPISAVAHRADAARAAGGFDVGLAACEDWDLWLRLASAGRLIRHLPVTVARRHWHAGSHTATPEPRHWEAYRSVYEVHRPRTAQAPAAFDPATWRELRQLACRAVLRRHEGYGVVGARLLLALEATGVQISMLPEGNQPPTGTESLHRPVPGPDRLAFYYDYRNRPSDIGYERVVFYTMWESSSVPDHLVRAANSAAAVLVPCAQNAAAFRAAGVTSPVAVLHHGVDPDEFPLLDRPERNTFTIGTFGHLSPRKGTDVLIRAFVEEFKPTEDARLVLKSSVDAACYQPDDPRIRLVSAAVEGRDLLRLLGGFDVMVLPSRGEGFGLCGLEAMATGLPLIATAWSGPAEYLDPADTFPLGYRLVDAGGVESNRVRYFGKWAEPDVDELRAHLRWAYEHPAEAAAMGRAASQRVHRDWTWTRVASDLVRQLDAAAAVDR